MSTSDSLVIKGFVGVFFFLMIVLIIYEVGGAKPTKYFLLLVLLGSLVTHTKQFSELGKLFN